MRARGSRAGSTQGNEVIKAGSRELPARAYVSSFNLVGRPEPRLGLVALGVRSGSAECSEPADRLPDVERRRTRTTSAARVTPRTAVTTGRFAP